MTDDATRALIAEANELVKFGLDLNIGESTRVFGELIAALEAATAETEWEWAIRSPGDDEPFSDLYDSLETLCDLESGIVWQPEELVRRRAPGPWVPVEGDKP